jgi:hypothetical protein
LLYGLCVPNFSLHWNTLQSALFLKGTACLSCIGTISPETKMIRHRPAFVGIISRRSMSNPIFKPDKLLATTPPELK